MITYRTATRDDLAVLVKLLGDDPLGAEREQTEEPLSPGYISAFEAISADPNNELTIASQNGTVVGVLQLTLIPNLTYRGSWRAQIEGVRVSKEARRTGVGRGLVMHAIDHARSCGCCLVQLTADRRRSEAIHFYEELGFVASHEGMKLFL